MPAFDAIGMDAVGATPSQASFNTVNLTAASSTETSTSSTGAATVTLAGAHVVNLTAAGSSETSTSSTGAASVTRPGVVVPVAINISQISTARIVVFEGSGSRVVVFD